VEQNYPTVSPIEIWEEQKYYCTHAWAAIAAYLRTKKVIIIKDGASILDDESEEELHGGIGQASGSFDKKDGQVVRILREVAEGRPCFLSAIRHSFLYLIIILLAHL
jgi:hypothetical protein